GRDRAVGQDTAEGAPRPPARKKRAAPRRRRAGGRRLQQAVDDPEEQLVTWRVAEHPFLAAVELVQPSLDGGCRSVAPGQDVGADPQVVAGVDEALVVADAFEAARVAGAELLE